MARCNSSVPGHAQPAWQHRMLLSGFSLPGEMRHASSHSTKPLQLCSSIASLPPPGLLPHQRRQAHRGVRSPGREYIGCNERFGASLDGNPLKYVVPPGRLVGLGALRFKTSCHSEAVLFSACNDQLLVSRAFGSQRLCPGRPRPRSWPATVRESVNVGSNLLPE
jgi:hypothetical protein